MNVDKMNLVNSYVDYANFRENLSRLHDITRNQTNSNCTNIFLAVEKKQDDQNTNKSEGNLGNKIDVITNAQIDEKIKPVLALLLNNIKLYEGKVDSNFNYSNVDNVDKLINEMFNYEKLPTIDIGKTRLRNGAINFIKPSQFPDNSPVGQFRDVNGRKGLAACATCDHGKTHKVQTFYQEVSNSPQWVSGGYAIIPVVGKYLIENGSVSVQACTDLQTLLRDKEITIKSKIHGKDVTWVLSVPAKN